MTSTSISLPLLQRIPPLSNQSVSKNIQFRDFEKCLKTLTSDYRKREIVSPAERQRYSISIQVDLILSEKCLSKLKQLGGNKDIQRKTGARKFKIQGIKMYHRTLPLLHLFELPILLLDIYTFLCRILQLSYIYSLTFTL